jgi:hypothetical protein
VEENDRAVLRGAALLAAVLAAGVVIYRFASAPPPLIPRGSPGLPAAAPEPAADLPRLEESDAFVRTRAAALSADPRFAAWLKPDDLISRAAAAANMISRGKVPADALAFLAPKSKFPVVKRRGRVYMDPRGFSRYDALGGAFSSIDAAAAARFFRDLEPLFQRAWESLGEKGGRVEDVFLRAAGELIQAPSLGPDVELKEGQKGIGWAFADPALEGLSPAQKQLLRMGPKNAAAIQFKLREIARALGASDAALAPAAKPR